MNTLRKSLAIISAVIALLGALSLFGACNKADLEVEVTFYFSKDSAGKEVLDTKVFDVGTAIYVHVDFKVVKTIKEEALFQYEVEVPYVDYYSTLRLQSGVFKDDGETSNPWTKYDSEGNEYNGRTLTLKPYTLTEKETPFPYVFMIEANSECKDVEFVVKIVQNGMSVVVNGEKTNEAKTSYSFSVGGNNE